MFTTSTTANEKPFCFEELSSVEDKDSVSVSQFFWLAVESTNERSCLGSPTNEMLLLLVSMEPHAIWANILSSSPSSTTKVFLSSDWSIFSSDLVRSAFTVEFLFSSRLVLKISSFWEFSSKGRRFCKIVEAVKIIQHCIKLYVYVLFGAK